MATFSRAWQFILCGTILAIPLLANEEPPTHDINTEAQLFIKGHLRAKTQIEGTEPDAQKRIANSAEHYLSIAQSAQKLLVEGAEQLEPAVRQRLEQLVTFEHQLEDTQHMFEEHKHLEIALVRLEQEAGEKDPRAAKPSRISPEAYLGEYLMAVRRAIEDFGDAGTAAQRATRDGIARSIESVVTGPYFCPLVVYLNEQEIIELLTLFDAAGFNDKETVTNLEKINNNMSWATPHPDRLDFKDPAKYLQSVMRAQQLLNGDTPLPPEETVQFARLHRQRLLGYALLDPARYPEKFAKAILIPLLQDINGSFFIISATLDNKRATRAQLHTFSLLDVPRAVIPLLIGQRALGQPDSPHVRHGDPGFDLLLDLLRAAIQFTNGVIANLSQKKQEIENRERVLVGKQQEVDITHLLHQLEETDKEILAIEQQEAGITHLLHHLEKTDVTLKKRASARSGQIPTRALQRAAQLWDPRRIGWVQPTPIAPRVEKAKPSVPDQLRARLDALTTQFASLRTQFRSTLNLPALTEDLQTQLTALQRQFASLRGQFGRLVGKA